MKRRVGGFYFWEGLLGMFLGDIVFSFTKSCFSVS